MRAVYATARERATCRARVVAALILALTGLPRDASAEPPPHIVVILADDLGYGDVGCYGGTRARTPHIDRLAAEGLRFSDFHSSGAMCSPTRIALLTGRYPSRFGPVFEGPHSAKDDADVGFPAGVPTLPGELRRAGYATAMVGKWHLGVRAPFLPTQRGFDEFRGLLTGDGDHHSRIDRSGRPDWWSGEELSPEDGYTTELITRRAVEFIERPHDRPFFLYVAHLAIHFPWQGPDERAHRRAGTDYWSPAKLGPHSEGEVAPVVRAMIEAVDASVGEIVAALRRRGLEEKTLVVFASDNGGYLEYGGRFRGEISSNGALRGGKGDFHEGGHRVPAIVRWPGRVEAGRTSGALATTADLMPTALQLAGLEAGGGELDGVSLVGHLLRDDMLPERTVFWRDGAEGALRRGDRKLVVAGPRVELYDLAADIGETEDLAASSPEVTARLLETYRAWERRVASPAGAAR